MRDETDRQQKDDDLCLHCTCTGKEKWKKTHGAPLPLSVAFIFCRLFLLSVSCFGVSWLLGLGLGLGLGELSRSAGAK